MYICQKERLGQLSNILRDERYNLGQFNPVKALLYNPQTKVKW